MTPKARPTSRSTGWRRWSAKGREFEVVDAKCGEDITRQVLTQIIVDEEARGSTMLPMNFLKQLIGLYGNSMQTFVPQYLEAAMDAFQRNQSAVRDAFGTNMFADIAKTQHGDVRGRGEVFTGKPAAKEKPKPRTRWTAFAPSLPRLQAKVDKMGR